MTETTDTTGASADTSAASTDTSAAKSTATHAATPPGKETAQTQQSADSTEGSGQTAKDGGNSSSNAKPDEAAMRAYLSDKHKDIALEGKSAADVAQLYADAQAKDSQAQAEFKVPDKYKDKGWASKVKTIDDVYQQLDTLDALKGKKSVVPNLSDPKLSKEDKEAFFSQLRGKDATEYPIPDNPAFPTPAETQPAVAKLFMENGVHPTQAEAIIKGYQELGATQVAQQFDPEGFKESMKTAFGDDWEKTTGAVRNTVKTMMNEDDQKALDHIPNSMLGVVYRTLGNTVKAVNETLKKYGATETFAHLQAPGGKVAATDVGSQRQGWRNELAAMTMRPHTEAERQVIMDKISKSYENDPRINQQ